MIYGLATCTEYVMNMITYTQRQRHCHLHMLAVIEFRGTSKLISLYTLSVYGQWYPVTLKVL